MKHGSSFCSAIGTALPLIKLRDHRSIKNIWEEQTLCRGMFGQAKASFLVSNPREQRICTIGEAFRVLKSRIFQARHANPGAERGTPRWNVLGIPILGMDGRRGEKGCCRARDD